MWDWGTQAGPFIAAAWWPWAPWTCPFRAGTSTPPRSGDFDQPNTGTAANAVNTHSLSYVGEAVGAACDRWRAEQVEICKREDGTDWLLGAGSYGKVGVTVSIAPELFPLPFPHPPVPHPHVLGSQLPP